MMDRTRPLDDAGGMGKLVRPCATQEQHGQAVRKAALPTLAHGTRKLTRDDTLGIPEMARRVAVAAPQRLDQRSELGGTLGGCKDYRAFVANRVEGSYEGLDHACRVVR